MSRWKYVILGIVVMMLLGTVYSYSVFRVAIEAFYQVGTAESGMPYMMALAFYSFFMFLTGKILKKYKPVTIIFFGGLLISLGWLLSSVSTNMIVLTVAYGCIGGAGVGIVYGVPMNVVAAWFPEKKGFAVGLVLVGFGLSPLITAPLAKELLEQYSLMTVFRILGISFGIALPLLSLAFRYPEGWLDQYRHDVHQQNMSGLQLSTKEMIHTKNFLGLYINFVIGTMIGLKLIGMTGNIGIEWIKISSKEMPRLIAMFSIFNGLGRPIFGELTDWLGTKKTMLLSYLLIGFSAILLLISQGQNKMVYLISFSVFWFNLGGWLAIAPASTIRLFGIKHYTQNYGLIFTAYGIGAILGVSTSGLLLDLHGDYQLLFYYVIVLCLIGSLLTWRLIRDAN
ncbi:MAG: OFA family MFS transporter [Tissierellales bacterium]|nr:OFA family MFS transporter [Tissierellales bacterium]MBN2828218.1 OFA family MFS transporter [Tissierellales bacterium]